MLFDFRIPMVSMISSLLVLAHIVGSNVRSSDWIVVLVPAVYQFTLGLVCVLVICLILVSWRAYQVRQMLVRCGLPTVFWRPRFVSYDFTEQDDRKKLAPSTVTNILPRMKRLGGPYGMYGTVYGSSTAVVHIAHPVPAQAVMGTRTTVPCSTTIGTPQSFWNSNQSQRRSSWLDSGGVCKAPAYDHFKNFCGDGVFTADGMDWKTKRAAVMHALLRVPGGYESKIEQETARAAQRFDEQVQMLIAQNTGGLVAEVDVVPLLQGVTIGLIYRYITDTDLLDSASTEKSFLPPRESNILSSYLESVVRIRMIILAQSRSVWFLVPRWFYRMFSSMYRHEQRTMGPIRRFARKAIQSAQPGSPLHCLGKDPIYKSISSYSTDVSDNLLYETITLLFAGQDTSAATLSWTLHLLSLYPAVQDKLFHEIQTVLLMSTSSDRDAALTRKDTAKMPFLDAVVKESMRLYPVAPFVVRKLPAAVPVVEQCNLTGESPGFVTIPSNSIACIWIYGLHRNPEFWQRPDDFWPERWMRDDNDAMIDKGVSEGAYMPFAHGPRNCVGQPLANIILRCLLARLLYCYEFHDPRLDSEPNPTLLLKEMQVGFTVLPSGGVRLQIKERRSSHR